jgi:hypothetical protein
MQAGGGEAAPGARRYTCTSLAPGPWPHRLGVGRSLEDAFSQQAAEHRSLRRAHASLSASGAMECSVRRAAVAPCGSAACVPGVANHSSALEARVFRQHLRQRTATPAVVPLQNASSMRTCAVSDRRRRVEEAERGEANSRFVFARTALSALLVVSFHADTRFPNSADALASVTSFTAHAPALRGMPCRRSFVACCVRHATCRVFTFPIGAKLGRACAQAAKGEHRCS